MGRGERKLLAVPAKKCVGVEPAAMGVAVCGCDGSAILSIDDLAQCLLCSAETAMTAMASTSLGSPDPSLLGSAGELRCHAGIATAQSRFVSRLLKLRSRCQRRQEKAGASDNSWCQDPAKADPKGRVAKARLRAESTVDKACRGVASPVDLDSCSTVGMAELKACVLDDADATASEAIDAFYPATRCGNAVVDVGEACDDGNGSNADGCLNDCSLASCGDAYLWVGVEECDDGNAVADGNGCQADCRRDDVCGNGIVEALFEQCDDGNLADDDGCLSDCRAAVCGDGVFWAGVEECDDGLINNDSANACRLDCRLPDCPDGIVDSGEQCDDGNMVDADGCRSDCVLGSCGNATVDSGEQCDDGNTVDGDGCDVNCTLTACGNAVVTAGEHCDDGNPLDWDACIDCVAATCGDGYLQVSVEQCDDGNTVSGDGCSAECLEEACVNVGGTAVYRWCPPNSSLDSASMACACDPGFEPGAAGCVDIDECASNPGICQGLNSGVCVNVPGSYSCATECTAAAFEASLANCGAPAGVITFNCANTTIGLANSAGWAARQISCDGLTIDGLDRDITFELTPACSVVAGSSCPNENNGVGFLVLNGNSNTVRNLTIRNFFEGIHTVGSYNTIASVVLDGQCDDSITNRGSGVGNLFSDLVIMNGCDKCTQNQGDPSVTALGVCPASAYNAVYDRVSFVDCVQPLRMTAEGRFLVRDSSISVSDGRCDGPRFSGGQHGDLVVYMEGNVIDGCNRGLRVSGKSQAVLRGNTIRNGSRRGVLVAAEGRALLEGNIIVGNGGSPPGAEPGYGGVAVADQASADLGGGSLVIAGEAVSSRGGNSLCANLDHVGGHGVQNLENLTLTTVAAGSNWWCDGAAAEQITGPAHTTPLLPTQP